MSTIYDVAKYCGVSIATVSRALNNHRDVNPKTKERIIHACRELNYQPSVAARGLSLNRSWSIGVFYRGGFNNPFFEDILTSFKSIVENSGYELFFFNSEYGNTGLEKAMSRALFRKVDGVLFTGLARTEKQLDLIVQSGLPCMSINLDVKGHHASFVESDHYGGTIKAMKFLVNNGHRKIGFFGERNMSTKSGYDRYRGFMDSVAEFNLETKDNWMLYGDFTEKTGYSCAKEIMKQYEVPTAILCVGDLVAIGAMEAFNESGLRTGKDISIIGFDDILISRYVTPRLTTVRQDKSKLGEIAAHQLIQLIEGGSPPHPIVLPTQLIIRDSVVSLI